MMVMRQLEYRSGYMRDNVLIEWTGVFGAWWSVLSLG